jgi:hypothetical protein
MATFYRVVKSNPPTEDDFLSHRARGVRLRRDTPENRRLWEGVSVTNTSETSRRLAERFPTMGHFVAVIELPEHASVIFEQTTDVPSHYTLWGTPRDMLDLVVSVVAI